MRMTQERLGEAGGYLTLPEGAAGVLGLLAALRNSSRAANGIMSKSCIPTRISKEKVGHRLEVALAPEGRDRDHAQAHDDRGLGVREHLDLSNEAFMTSRPSSV